MAPTTKATPDRPPHRNADDPPRSRRAGRARHRLKRAVLAMLCAVLAASALLVPGASPASATTSTSKTIQGSGQGTFSKEWFNTHFNAGLPFGGGIEGRIRFVTDTTTTVSNTRTISANPMGTVDGGNKSVQLSNTNTATRMQIKSRPALQIVFDYDPNGGSSVCNVDSFPTMPGDDWRMELPKPAGSAHRCGAIEVTADDLNPIFRYYGIDLKLPEVFDLFDQFVDPGYTGSRTYSETHQLFEIHVCEMASKAFALPIGDHCSFQINAVVNPVISAAPGHHAKVQYCTDGTINGNTYPCLFPAGTEKDFVWTGPNKNFLDQLPCIPSGTSGIGVRIKDPSWDIHLDSVGINVSIDFNVNATQNGDGWDLATINIPTGIDLIDNWGDDSPYQAISLTYPNVGTTIFNVGTLTPDTTAPFAGFVGPNAVEEGKTSTVTAAAIDNCDTPDELKYKWQFPGQIVNKTGDNSYSRFFATEGSWNGSVTAMDKRGNVAPLSTANINIVNAAPDVTLNVPLGIPVGTAGSLSAPVVDAGPDIETWNWNFGDGTTASRVGTSTTDRNDTRSKTYNNIGRYVVTTSVADDDVTTTKKTEVGVFQPGSAFNMSGTHTTDSGSVSTGVGTPFTANLKAQYKDGQSTPSGSFALDAQIPIGGGEVVPAYVVGTNLSWLLTKPTSVEVQAPVAVNSVQGWTMRATYTRASATSPVTKVNVKLWQPGKSSISDTPYYVFNGI